MADQDFNGGKAINMGDPRYNQDGVNLRTLLRILELSGGGASSITGTVISVSQGTNILTGGTAAKPSVSVTTTPTFSTLYSTTLSGGTIFSAGTNLYSIFTNIGQRTFIQEGSNVYTGGTDYLPSIHVTDSPSFNNIRSSGTTYVNILSGGSAWLFGLTGSSIYSTNFSASSASVSSLFASELSGSSIYSTNFSASSASVSSLFTSELSGTNIYSGSTNLNDLFSSTASTFLRPSFVAFGSQFSGITGTTGLTYNSNSYSSQTNSGFRINSVTGGTKFEVYQADRSTSFATAFTVSTTSTGGGNGATNVTVQSRVGGSTLSVLDSGNGMTLTTSLDAANGISTNNADLAFGPSTGIIRPSAASMQIGTANRNISTIHMGTGSILQGASTSVAFTLGLGGTRDDGAANKSALLIQGASAYTTTHYLSVTDNVGRTMFTIAPSGRTGVALGGSGTGVITPTAFLDIQSGNTSYAPLRIRSGATPSSILDGYIWYDGTNLLGRINGSTKQLDNVTTTVINFADSETPSGAIDGVNTVFNLANTYTVGSTHVYLDGLRMRPGVTNDYVETIPQDITFNVAPIPGQILLVDYRY